MFMNLSEAKEGEGYIIKGISTEIGRASCRERV